MKGQSIEIIEMLLRRLIDICCMKESRYVVPGILPRGRPQLRRSDVIKKTSKMST